MKKILAMVLVTVACGSASASVGCTGTSMTWLKYEKCSPRRSPDRVRVYYTRKAIGGDYKVVAKYRVHTNSRHYAEVLRKVKVQAAKHGVDAIVVDQGYGVTTTIWSWLLFFIPVTEHSKVLMVSGIRYLPAGVPPVEGGTP